MAKKTKWKKDAPLGIFDSGVGGLTVLKEIKRLLPQEEIIYLGDTAHLPYGAKSKETIIKLAIANILFLLNKDVKLIVVACNSTSSVALPEIKNFFSLPILGVVEAGVKEALRGKPRRVGIIGTQATIRSQTYQNLLRKNTSFRKIKILAQSCPLFVPLVEEGWIDSPLTEAIAKKYLKKFKNKIDLLILGCTHYPLLKEVIKKVLGKIKIVDSAEVVAKETKRLLQESGLLKNSFKKSKDTFYLTDNSPSFSKLMKLILGKTIKPEIINV